MEIITGFARSIDIKHKGRQMLEVAESPDDESHEIYLHIPDGIEVSIIDDSGRKKLYNGCLLELFPKL